jgi:hypothetical protein
MLALLVVVRASFVLCVCCPCLSEVGRGSLVRAARMAGCVRLPVAVNVCCLSLESE